jgi:hypothetical protein
MLAQFAYIGRSFVYNSKIGGQNHGRTEFQELTVPSPDCLPNSELPDVKNHNINPLDLMISDKFPQISIPLERTEREVFEPLSFPIDMADSVNNIEFPGLEVRDLFGTPVPDFHLIFR